MNERPDLSTLPVDRWDLAAWAEAASRAGEHGVALPLALASLPAEPTPLDHMRLARFHVLAQRFDEASAITTAHGDAARELTPPKADRLLRATIHAARAPTEGRAWAALRRMGEADAPQRRREIRALLLAVATARGDDEVVATAAQLLWQDDASSPRSGGRVARDARHLAAVAWMRERPRPAWFVAEDRDERAFRHVADVATAFDVRDPFPERSDADLVAAAAELRDDDARLLLEHANAWLGTERVGRALESFRRPREHWRRPVVVNSIAVAALTVVAVVAPPALLLLVPILVVAVVVLVRVPPLSIGDSRVVHGLWAHGVDPEDGRIARDQPLPDRLVAGWFAAVMTIAGVGVAVLGFPREREPLVGHATPEIVLHLLVSGAVVFLLLRATGRARRELRAALLAPLRRDRADQLARPTLQSIKGAVEEGALAAAVAETADVLPGEVPSVLGHRTRPLVRLDDQHLERLLLVEGERPLLLTQRSGPWRPVRFVTDP